MSSAVSPELALVDPQLGARLRAELPDPGHFIPATPPQIETPPVDAVQTHYRVLSPRARANRAALAAIGAVAATLAALVLYVGRPTDIAADAAGAQEASAPRAAEQTSRRYTWTNIPGAKHYFVTLLHGRDTVYHTLTQDPALTIPRTLRLHRGRYTWVVQAAGTTRLTPLLESSFDVPG